MGARTRLDEIHEGDPSAVRYLGESETETEVKGTLTNLYLFYLRVQ